MLLVLADVVAEVRLLVGVVGVVGVVAVVVFVTYGL
jgi:hypothetical protein